MEDFLDLLFAFRHRQHLHDQRADLTRRACKPCQLMRSSQTCPSGHQKARAQGPFAFVKPAEEKLGSVKIRTRV